MYAEHGAGPKIGARWRDSAFLGGPLALGPVCAGRALALATHPASTSDPHYGLLIDEAVGAGTEDLCVLFCV
jgi:hypothetical protein